MIHKYKQLGLNIVMDVYSGAVHVVDDVMYDMLDYTLEPFMAEAKCPDYIKEGLKDKYSEEELEESYAEICALVNAGQLFTDDCYDEIAKNWNKQSVVKALFDIESDFVKVNIHMGCNAVIVMNAHDIGVVFLYQTIFHSWVIGLPYLPNNFLAFLPDFLQCFILDMRFYYIPWLSIWLLSFCSNFQLKAKKFRVMAFQIYDL